MPSTAMLPGLRVPQADGARPDLVTGVSLALRVPVFTLVTLGLGVGGHVLAGGSPPSCGRLLVLALLVALAWRVVAGGEQSLGRLTPTLWVMQVGVHEAMVGGGCHPVAGAGPGSAHSAGHLAASGGALMSCSGMPSGMVHASGAPGAGMWLTHAAAGLLVAVWLRRGEVSAWRAARRLLPRLPRAAAALPARRRQAWGCAPVVELHGPVLVLLGDPRRGPPLSSR